MCPRLLAAREPLAYAGINSIGLKRRGIEDKTISAIETIYKNLFVLQKNLSAGMQMVENEIPESPEKEQILSFIKSSEKGVIRSMLQK